MFCEFCGKEILDDSRYCNNCGKQLRTRYQPVKEKNMFIALFLSLFLPGLGLCYTGSAIKGIVLFMAIIITNVYGSGSVILLAISWILWAYALYATYREVKTANGESPNLIEDIVNLPNYENKWYIAALALILIFFCFIIQLMFY